MVARQEAEIDRSFGFDTCLASFLPEVTGRLETRPKRPLGKFFSLEYIIRHLAWNSHYWLVLVHKLSRR